MFTLLVSFGWWKCDREIADQNSALSILFKADLDLRYTMQPFTNLKSINLQVN